MKSVRALGVLWLAACAAPADEPSAAAADSIDAMVADSGVVTMPDFPSAPPGWLSVVTAAAKPEYLVTDGWPVSATRCFEPDFLQVVQVGRGIGVAVVIGLPPADSAVDHYIIVRSDRGPPAAGTARVAMQLYPEQRAYTLPGVGGTVELFWSESVVSGRFAVDLVETIFRDTVRLAGSFANIGVNEGMGEECQTVTDGTVSPGVPPSAAGGRETRRSD